MCTNIEGKAIPCGEPEDHFISICQPEVDRHVESVYERFPMLRLWVADPRQPGCCQRDAVAEAHGWEAAQAWQGLQWILHKASE